MWIDNIKNSWENLSFIDFSSELNRNNELYRALIDLSSLGKNWKEFLLKNPKNEEKKLKAKYSKWENWISWLEVYENLKNKDWKIEERRILFMNLENWNSFIWAWDEETLRVNSKDFFVEKEFANWFWINSWKSNSKDWFSKIICNYENWQKMALILNSIEAVFSTKDQIRNLKEEISKEENFYYDEDWNKIEIKTPRNINILWKDYDLSDVWDIIDKISRNKILLQLDCNKPCISSNLYSILETYELWGKKYYQVYTLDEELGRKKSLKLGIFLDENLRKATKKYNWVDKEINNIFYTTDEKKYIWLSIKGKHNIYYYDIEWNRVYKSDPEIWKYLINPTIPPSYR